MIALLAALLILALDVAIVLGSLDCVRERRLLRDWRKPVLTEARVREIVQEETAWDESHDAYVRALAREEIARARSPLDGGVPMADHSGVPGGEVE